MVPGERGGAGRRREAAQRLLRLRVSQQVEERDDDPAHLRGRDGDDRRRGRKQGRAGDGAQRGDVVVELQQQRVEAAGEAGGADAVRGQLVARGRQREEGIRRGLRGRERDGAAVPGHRAGARAAGVLCSESDAFSPCPVAEARGIL